MPRRRKLRILRFAFRGKSSVVPLCPEEIPLGDSSSPTKPTYVGLWRGPYWRPPLNPQGVNGLVAILTCFVRTAFPKGTSFGRATVHLTRLSRLRCREANTLGVRSAYPLASACCAAQKDSKTYATTQLPTTN